MIYPQLHPGHFGVHVGDSSQRNEEIVKKSQIVPLNVIIINVMSLRGEEEEDIL